MPPKNLLKVYGLIAAIAVIAVVIVTIVVMAGSAATGNSSERSKPAVDRDNLVRIQVRAPKRVLVIVNGRPKGQAPMMMLVPRSETPVSISVTLGAQTYTKQVTPREDSIVDFP